MDGLVKDLLDYQAKHRTTLKNTVLAGLKVELKDWKKYVTEPINYYYVKEDDNVTDKTGTVVRFMQGCHVPSHITLVIAEGQNRQALEAFQSRFTSKYLSEKFELCVEVTGVGFFRTDEGAKRLGSHCYGMVHLLLKPSPMLIALRNGLKATVPVTTPCFSPEAMSGDVQEKWRVHCTIAYVKDKESMDRLLEALGRAFPVGTMLNVTGWFSD